MKPESVFPRYPEYRDSGVEWLGDVPSHWEVTRIQDCVVLLNGFPFESEFFNPTDGVPIIRIRDIALNQTETYYSGANSNQAVVQNGDILIGMDGDFNVGWWKGGGAVLNQRLCCLRPNLMLNKRFLFYLLGIPLKIINDLTWFTTVKHLSSIDVLKIRLGYPPLPEQQAIAAFLDQETAKIDTLIEKAKQSIELMKERRAALISSAVTGKIDVTSPQPLPDAGRGESRR